MRLGDVEIRPLGGGPGCLLMILISVVGSIVLTVLQRGDSVRVCFAGVRGSGLRRARPSRRA